MGDDVHSAIVGFREEHPEFDAVTVVWASTPDYAGSMQEGYAAAVESILLTIPEGGDTVPGQVTLLPGAHMTPADVEEVKELIEAFGLTVVCVPDLSAALDGHIDDEVSPLSTGGTPLPAIRSAGRSRAALFVGNSLARAASKFGAKFRIPVYGVSSVTGLRETDRLVSLLSTLSGREAPESVRRRRSRLLDAMVDTHYRFGGKKAVVALETDALKTIVGFLAGMGVEVTAAVAATRTRGLSEVEAAELFVGDLEDVERVAAGVDLLVANSNGRQAATKLGLKAHLRAGYPVFDRLGAHQKVWSGYRGTMNLVFEVANLFQATAGEARKGSHN
jgi:nitrogenase molybdenum-cofactor synthesis protein NifE